MTEQTCGTCRFWDRVTPGSDDGICRAHPPAASYGWPYSQAAEWCGEWQQAGRVPDGPDERRLRVLPPAA